MTAARRYRLRPGNVEDMAHAIPQALRLERPSVLEVVLEHSPGCPKRGGRGCACEPETWAVITEYLGAA